MTQQLDEQPSAFDDNTVVLANRLLRSDSDSSKLSRFGDSVWDLSPGILENHTQRYIINFEQIPLRWLTSVKTYFWTLINEESAKPILDAPSAPRQLALSSIAMIMRSLRWLILWFDAHGYDTLQTASPKVLDRLLADLGESELMLTRRRQVLVETRRVWAHRNVVSPQLRMPEAAPWQEERPGDLLSHRFNNTGNLTPRISDETLIPLMAWAIRFIDEFAPDITAAYHDYLNLISNDYRHTLKDSRTQQPSGTRRLRLEVTINRLRQLGLGLPGRPGPSGEPTINWMHLGRLTGSFGNTHAYYDRETILNSGLPVDPQSFVTTSCTSMIDGRLWSGPYIAWDDVIPLAIHLQTACFIAIAYLSGMRPGEALNLERGCHSVNPSTQLHELHGTTWKNAHTPGEAKDPEGQSRRNPWIVHPLVGKAVEVLEQVHTSELLFPSSLRPRPLRGTKGRADARAGSGQTAAKMTTDIGSFIAWVNDYCVRHQRNDRIPEDADGRITAKRFRRTLAWHIVRRPRGLIAAAIQYNHISTLVTQGYSGNYHSGFPSELAMERWLERVERLTDIDQYLESGGHVSGPAAEELRERTRQATSKFQGRVLPTRRQAEKLLTDPSLQVFKGDGLHCVFDKTTALCTKKRGCPELRAVLQRLQQYRAYRCRYSRSQRCPRSSTSRQLRSTDSAPPSAASRRTPHQHHLKPRTRKLMKTSDSASIRAALQKAAEDLLEGRVPGPLTGVRLIEIAGVKRHRLTHDNPDINISFQKRAREINRSKPEVESLRDQLAHERERAKRLSRERDALTEHLRNYATAMMMVTNERDQLLEQIQANGNIVPINRSTR